MFHNAEQINRCRIYRNPDIQKMKTWDGEIQKKIHNSKKANNGIYILAF